MRVPTTTKTGPDDSRRRTHRRRPVRPGHPHRNWTSCRVPLTLNPIYATTTERYGYTADGDTADLTLNSTNTVTERTISLLGGVLVTKRGTANTDVWSYPNIHGDTAATANGSGTKTGGTYTYDPYGNPLNGQPDNSAGDYKYGWEGKNQKGTDTTQQGLPIIEMGARLYVPALGRFLQTDPIPGGSANAYDYCNGDPVNSEDLAGTHPPKVHWIKLRLSRAHPRAQFVNLNGIFDVQYNYATRSLQWSMRLSFPANVAFRGKKMDSDWNVWVSGRGIGYHAPHYEVSFYLYHQSLRPGVLRPGGNAQIEFLAANDYAILGAQYQVYVGRS